MSTSTDDAFAAFVRKSEEDEAKAKKGSGNGSSSFNFESQTWVGLDQGRAHIVRLTGNPPESMTPGFKAGPTDAHEIFFETVKDDNGKRMQLRLPCHAADPNDEHIMWRIINRVREIEWVADPENPGKRKKIFKNEKTLVFDKISHGGFDPNNPMEADSYRYSRGWGGQQVCIMNVIDREDDWCKENKHTKLLSKRVTERAGVVYPTVGVPSYGFLTALTKLVKVYGPWENYDVQIVKTGQMNTPYDIKNASYYKSVGVPEIDSSKLPVISVDQGLTAEEKEYERYDIAKLYSPTSYRSLRDRLGKTIKEVDDTLMTHFYDELASLAEKEEAERAAKAAEKAAQAEVAPAPVQEAAPVQPSFDTMAAAQPTAPVAPAPQPAMTVRGTRNISVLAPEKIAALKGYAKLTDAQKAQIADVTLNTDGSVNTITYTEGSANQCSCNNCMKPSPQDFLSCPVCGCDFA